LKTDIYKKCIFNLILLFSCVLHAETNNITYTDLTSKEVTVSKIEDLYYLKVSKSVRLTGENFLDLNNFSGIQRVRTYTTIKIEF
jgi:hypothetical protein